MPEISVITSVYNCEEYIEDTIKSVIKQTFSDWEYIIIDDCSSDRSKEIIEKYASSDSRIIYIRNSTNKGQSTNLNTAISMSKGRYIARLDHDDICIPDRFRIQYEYMENHSNTVLLGCRHIILKDGKEYWCTNLTRSDDEVRFLAAFGIQDTIHSAFFIRKSAMIENKILYRDFDYAEDYGLYSELLTVGDVHILEDTLVKYRVFDGNTTSKTTKELKYNESRKIILKYLECYKHIDFSIFEKSLKGDIHTKSEYQYLPIFVRSYAKQCGIDDADGYRNPCMSFALYNVLLWQKGCIYALFTYIRSGLAYDLKFVNYNLKMLKHCVLKERKLILTHRGKGILTTRY